MKVDVGVEWMMIGKSELPSTSTIGNGVRGAHGTGWGILGSYMG